jgi:hypothetical protein
MFDPFPPNFVLAVMGLLLQTVMGHWPASKIPGYSLCIMNSIKSFLEFLLDHIKPTLI